MGDAAARTDDLHVPGLERQPLSVVAVVVFDRILEHESSDLEAAVRVFADQTAVVAPGVGPVEKRRERLQHRVFARKGDGFPFLYFLVVKGAGVLVQGF